MAERRRNRWGWGFEDAVIGADEAAAAAPHVRGMLGFDAREPEAPVALEQASLPARRLEPPSGALAAICAHDDATRAQHAYGKSYLDTIRAFRGVYDCAPDVVARPRDEHEIEALLEWAVGVERGGDPLRRRHERRRRGRGARARALRRHAHARPRCARRAARGRPVSRAARIGAGASGPRLEEQLGAHGLTMRFYPQSFELSTLGGWIATRAGGHFATGPTHIDDLVESVRAITPSGAWASRRLPGSGAGPSPDRMLLGSEGTLGVITEAWVRVQPRPEHRAARAVRLPDVLRGADAVRAIVQSGLTPANCRLLDELEAAQTGAGDGTPRGARPGLRVDREPGRARHGACAGDRARARRGLGRAVGPPAGDSVGAWREAFIRMPYLRDMLMRLGILADTFETAITWDRFPAFHASVMGAVREALGEPCRVSCRFTHVYPDGPAPYITVMAPARRGDEIAQWHEMKRAAGDAIIAGGGTITHHHAVGRDHRPWYDLQRPDAFAAALAGAKAAVDPAGMLNPGVLIDDVRLDSISE